MNRRGFLSRLTALPIAAALAFKMPQRVLIERPRLQVNRLPDPEQSMLRGNDAGISIRYVRQFSVEAGAPVRFDVLFGMATLSPQFAVKVAS